MTERITEIWVMKIFYFKTLARTLISKMKKKKSGFFLRVQKRKKEGLHFSEKVFNFLDAQKAEFEPAYKHLQDP